MHIYEVISRDSVGFSIVCSKQEINLNTKFNDTWIKFRDIAMC